MWPLSPIELGGMHRRHPFIMLVQAAEDYAYRHADAVVSLLPKVREYMESRGMAPHKLHCIPNGFDPEEWSGTERAVCADIGEAILSEKQAGKFAIGYAGSHGRPNSLDALLDAANCLTEKKFAFFLVGDGLEKLRLRQRVIDEKLTNVWMFDPVPKKEIPFLLSRFDAVYVGGPRAPLYRFGVSPNKLLDYMMAGIPVVYAIEAGNDPVAEAGCGYSVAAEDGTAIADAIARLARLSIEERRMMGARGREHAMRHYAYPQLAKKFLQIMEKA